ncbi:unnamed protein product, partial [Meganyctiphanes norvegica]
KLQSAITLATIMWFKIASCFIFLGFNLVSAAGSGPGTGTRQGPRDCDEIYQAGNEYEGFYAIFPNSSNPDEGALVYCGVNEGLFARNTSAPRTNAKNCQDLKDGGMNSDGINVIYPYANHPESPIIVFCRQELLGGGWTVFQRRDDFDSQLDFYKTFDEYAQGFGNVGTEFYLGNDIIHELTQQGVNELYIELTSFAGVTKYAHYDMFNVGPRDDPNPYAIDYYQLTVGHFSGTAGDSLNYHNGYSFTTYDADHDTFPNGNCADVHEGAWWHGYCGYANLNGRYYEDAESHGNTAIFWDTFNDVPDNEPLKKTAMMTRGLKQQ